MRRVTDAEQPRPVPAAQPVHLDLEHGHVGPAAQLVHPVGERRLQRGQVGAEGVQPGRPQPVVAALLDHVPELPVVAAVEPDQHPPRRDPPAGAGHVGAAAGQPEPEHVHRCVVRPYRQPGRPSDRRPPPVRGHRERRRDDPAGDGQPGDSPPLDQQPGRLGLHQQPESRVSARVPGDGVEEVPLRHQCDLSMPARDAPEVGQRPLPVAGGDAHLGAPLLIEPRELVAKPQLVEQRQRGRVDRVTAKVPQEVTVLLDHRHPQPRPSQQQSEHRPRRPAPRDHAVDPLHRPSFTPARPSGYPGSVGAGNRPVRS